MQNQDCDEVEALTPTGATRRNLLLGAGAGVAVATLALSEGAYAATGHSGHGGMYGSVVDSSLGCVKAGQACMNHCLELFKMGDTSVADCAAMTQQMLAMCTAMSQLASLNSSFAPDLSRVCAETCKACEKECLKHAKKHAECKACADSCKHCAMECEKIAA